MRVAIGIEYDGSSYCGWQKQNFGKTIQEHVEKALTKVADTAVTVVCAGRTDAGVHALGQIAHFDVDVVRESRAWMMGANTYLPSDIRLLWAKSITSEFHARYSAVARYYRYIIRNRPYRSAFLRTQETWCYRPLDVDLMQKGADFLVGKHDFSSYRAQHCQSKSPIRTMYSINVQREGENILIDLVANAFLHHMVRNIAAVLIKIGSGQELPEWALNILLAKNRQAGDITALPFGLYLVGISYPKQFRIQHHLMFNSIPGLQSRLI